MQQLPSQKKMAGSRLKNILFIFCLHRFHFCCFIRQLQDWVVEVVTASISCPWCAMAKKDLGSVAKRGSLAFTRRIQSKTPASGQMKQLRNSFARRRRTKRACDSSAAE